MFMNSFVSEGMTTTTNHLLVISLSCRDIRIKSITVDTVPHTLRVSLVLVYGVMTRNECVERNEFDRCTENER